MTEEQANAVHELIRIARVVSVTARGLWYYMAADSYAEAALRDMEQRLDEASERARAALVVKDAPVAQVH